MYTALLIHNIGKIESLNPSILSTKLAPKFLDEFNHLNQQLSRFREFLLSFDEHIPLSFSHLKPDTYAHLVDLVGNLGDSLENYLTEVPGHQTSVQNILLSLPNNYFMPLIQLQVRDAIFRVEAIAEVFLYLELPARRRTGGIIQKGTEIETSSVVEAEVIGRENEKEMIVQRLVESSYEEGIEVIPIVGIGGIGKTALATLIYNDERVTSYFELKSWAQVSRTSSLRSIAGGILKPHNLKRIPEEDVMELVRQKIQGKRWLLVLDGVEDKNLVMRLITELKSASGRDTDSKLLMTTRSSLIPLSFTRQGPVLLKGLSVQHAWSLLERIAFKEGQKPRDPRIIETGKEIIKEVCEGVPLIIKVIGSLLRNKDSLQEWLSFKEHGLLKSSQIPSADVEIIFKSLKSSLDHLPANMQLCFAYCGLFPKRRDIDLHTLIALWMAQGFIYPSSSEHDHDHSRTEDIGYGYFCKLLELNLFHGHQVQEGEWGRDRSCRMQDLMHDLALYVSSNRIMLMDPHGEAVHEKVQHITLDFNLDSSWKIPKSLLKAQGLRTLLLSPQSRLPHEMNLSTSTCHAIFSSCKRLRVLDLHDLGMKTVPNSLGKLKYLRYLDLSQNSFATLPRSTTSLFNLQTLKLSNCHMLKELPEGFNNLINLRHLEIDGCFSLTHMPLGLGCLTSLQTLSRFVVSNIHNSASSAAGGLEQLMSLDKLRGNLEILHLERAKCNPSKDHNPFLDNKQQLQCLTLRWNRDFDDDGVEEDNPDEGDDERLLKILKPHPNLKELSIMGFKRRFPSGYFTDLNLVRLSLYYCPIIQFLPPLHKLPSLQILELQRLEAMESVADSYAYAPTEPFFPSLKEVTIWDCPRLTSWWKSRDVLPEGTAEFPSRCIQRLEIRYCPELTTIPFYPEKLILVCYSMDQLEQIMKKMAERPSSSPSHASSSSSSPVHCGLKSLFIGRIEDLKSLPEGLKSFTSLQCLHIQDCHKLTSLLQGIQHISSLEYLNIENCMELNLRKDEDNGSQWNGLINLRTLIIKGIPKLEALPQGLAHANSLQDLQLYSCPQLMSLPKWIGELTFLHTLTIEDCPKLLPRCQQETGEDWPQIAHIKNKSLK